MGVCLRCGKVAVPVSKEGLCAKCEDLMEEKRKKLEEIEERYGNDELDTEPYTSFPDTPEDEPHC